MDRGDRMDNWGVLGEWTNLTCSVYAEPPVHFDWYHKGRKLSTSDEFILSTPEINVSILQVSQNTSLFMRTVMVVVRRIYEFLILYRF
jgi:hypothetical protein